MGSLVVSVSGLAVGALGHPSAGVCQKPRTVVLSLVLGPARIQAQRCSLKPGFKGIDWELESTRVTQRCRGQLVLRCAGPWVC